MAKDHSWEFTGSGWFKLRGYWLVFHYSRQLYQRISVQRIGVDAVPKLIMRKGSNYSPSAFTQSLSPTIWWLTNEYEAIL